MQGARKGSHNYSILQGKSKRCYFTDTETGKTYTVIKSTMTFTVENGVVTSTTGDADNLNDKATKGYYYYDKTKEEILVCDAEAVNVVSISKQDAASSAEVAGATL